jgi:hypothetical protein
MSLLACLGQLFWILVSHCPKWKLCSGFKIIIIRIISYNVLPVCFADDAVYTLVMPVINK